MEEKSPFQLSPLTHCTLTICDEISSDDGKLHTLLTNALQFKIIGFDPLVIEKDCPSPDDIYKLLEALKDLQHSHTRKDYKSVEHHRDSIELQQKKENIPCDSSVQKSLQSVHENRQLTDCSIVNYCEVNSSYEVASHEAQGSNDDMSDLTNIFQDLKVNDASNGHDHVQEQKEFANNVSKNTLREVTNVPLEPENESIALLENVTGAEKQKDCQDVEEEKKQIEKPQPEYLINQGANNLNGNTLREVTSVPLEPENEIIELLENVTGAEKQKDCQDVEEEKKRIEKPQPEYLINQGANNLNGNTLQEVTNVPLEPKNESIALLENVTGAEKQKDCQDVGEGKKQTEKPQPEYLRNQGSVAEHSSAHVQIIQNTSTTTENEMKRSSRNHKQKQDGQYIGQIDSRKGDNNCTSIADDNHDILNQEHLSKHQDFASGNMQILTLKDGGNKTKILKQGDVGDSEIFSSTDSSDSDAESHHNIIYSIKASSLDGIKMYFKGICNEKYFEDVKSDGTSYLFKLKNSCEEDVSFLSELKKIKVEECKFDYQDNIYSAVKDIQSPKRDMIVYIKDNKVQIVGLKDSVISAKKKLQDMITNDKSTVTRTESLEKKSQYTLKNQEKSRISDDIKTDKPGRSKKFEDNDMPPSHDLYNPSSSPLEYRDPKLKADKTTYSGDNKYDIFSKTRGIYYVRKERMQLKVTISNADITKLEVDCIVNAANKKLQHFGGVARVISRAAGPVLKKECEDFTRFGDQVAVTDIFVTTGGEMPAKWVMHAVGPKWDAYDNKAQCFEDLRHTVVRCLVEAGRRGFTSIALPSISAAIFKVPKQDCARCYMEAVKHFGLFKEQTSLQDIQFVDVDDTMVTIIQEQFERNWTKSSDPHIVQKDCDFAKGHIYTGNRNAAKNSETFSSSSVSTKTPGASKASSDLGSRLPIGSRVASTSEMRTGKRFAYLIGTFTLRTDNRPAFNLPSDITITVGKPFDKLSGLPDFSVSSNQTKKEGVKNIYKMYEVSKPKSSHRRKLCALLPEPDDAETIKQSIGNLETVIQSPNHKTFMETVKNVVLTSSILYGDPYNTQKKDKKKHTCDRKKVGHFARCLFECLKRASGLTALIITLVGDEDALQIICEVLETRDVKRIPLEASTSSHQGGGSRRGDNSNNQQSYSRRNLFDDKWNDNEANSSSHQGAISRSSTRGDNFDHPQTNSAKYTSSHSDDSQYGNKDAGSSVDLDTCEICVDQKANYFLRCCGKYLCQDCEKKMANCPYCRRFWRLLTGKQPPGTMTVRVLHDGFLEIKYSFPSGVQEACHPNPGAPYTGMNRTAYLPMNNDGLSVLMLLRIAFLRRLTFTIGRSLTTEKENSITWNDIHHKTSRYGGPHGYPDPSYLIHVIQELANKGVTFDRISADERAEITDFEYHILNFGFFNDYHPR